MDAKSGELVRTTGFGVRVESYYSPVVPYYPESAQSFPGYETVGQYLSSGQMESSTQQA